MRQKLHNLHTQHAHTPTLVCVCRILVHKLNRHTLTYGFSSRSLWFCGARRTQAERLCRCGPPPPATSHRHGAQSSIICMQTVCVCVWASSFAKARSSVENSIEANALAHYILHCTRAVYANINLVPLLEKHLQKTSEHWRLFIRFVMHFSIHSQSPAVGRAYSCA